MAIGSRAVNYQDLLINITKLIEGGLQGDSDAIRAYANELGDRLDTAGEGVLANSIRTMAKRGGRQAKLARATRETALSLPVDGESRLPVADEEHYHRGDIQVVLSGTLKTDVEQFLKTFRASDRLSAAGIEIAASMLLYGPPGCGKTQIARFIASELELPLIVARMDSLISSYLGSTAKNLRMLFEFAASHPCILFLDEFDALAKMRDDSRELGELKRVVISLLQNIDALGRDHLIIAATNHDHLLDPAVWRRFAHRIHVGNPDQAARRLLLQQFYRGFVDSKSLDEVVFRTEGLSGAQLRDIAERAVRDAILQGKKTVSREDAIGEAMRAIVKDGDAESLKDRIRYLYAFDKKFYTQIKLASMFDKSQSQISRILKEARDGEPESP